LAVLSPNLVVFDLGIELPPTTSAFKFLNDADLDMLDKVGLVRFSIVGDLLIFLLFNSLSFIVLVIFDKLFIVLDVDILEDDVFSLLLVLFIGLAAAELAAGWNLNDDEVGTPLLVCVLPDIGGGGSDGAGLADCGAAWCLIDGLDCLDDPCRILPRLLTLLEVGNLGCSGMTFLDPSSVLLLFEMLER
jgi:hypothetical protein